MKLKETNPFIVWAKWGGMDRRPTLCSLFWHVMIWAPGKFIVFSIVGAVIAGITIGLPIFGLICWIGTGTFDIDFFVLIIVTFWVAVIFTVLGFMHHLWVSNRTWKPIEAANEAYRGFKDNYCPMIEIEKEH